MLLCLLCTWVPHCDEIASMSYGNKFYSLLPSHLGMCSHTLMYLCIFTFYLFFLHWDFINRVIFQFVVLLIEKLDSDPEKHDLFLAKQRVHAKSTSGLQETKNALKEKVHVSYLSPTLFRCFYTGQEKIDCNHYEKSSQEIPCQLCTLCLYTASDKVACKVTPGVSAVTLTVRHPQNGWKQLTKKHFLLSRPFKESKSSLQNSSQRITVWPEHAELQLQHTAGDNEAVSVMLWLLLHYGAPCCPTNML